jgi:hypothetical protein
MVRHGRSPRITRLSWGRIEVEGGRSFKEPGHLRLHARAFHKFVISARCGAEPIHLTGNLRPRPRDRDKEAPTTQ